MIQPFLFIFNKMIRIGSLPDVKNCNRMLRIFRDRDLVTKAREVYKMMDECGVMPTIVTYNTLLDAYCKKG